jgi:hypothetical protein
MKPQTWTDSFDKRPKREKIDMRFGLWNVRSLYRALKLWEEHRLGVFENRVLRRIFGPKRDEVTGEWRKLHNEVLHDLYSSPSIIRIIKARRMRWAGHVARMGEKRNTYRLLVGKPEGSRQLGRPRSRWLDNIRVDGVMWTGLVWLRIGTGGELL